MLQCRKYGMRSTSIMANDVAKKALEVDVVRTGRA